MRRDPLILPSLHLLPRWQSPPACEDARRVHGLPLEDLEREPSADSADEKKRWVVLPDDMLEGEGPAVAGTEDDVVHVGDAGAVDEMHGPAGDFGNGRVLLDLGMIECGVAEKDVCGMADSDAVNGRLRRIDDINCNVCC
ncbi:hypothetical protein HG530_005413 [Fusarium avenaceum]|nr:hypothetical protein HG530_005413 [Fusarium avenaceum]